MTPATEATTEAMDGIPEDIRATAEALTPGTMLAELDVVRGVVARAIVAERERCAAVVEAKGSDAEPELANWLAAAIRATP